MTLEQQAGNRLVAEAIGYTIQEWTFNNNPCWMLISPEGEKLGSNTHSPEGAFAMYGPDIFAQSSQGGAAAREQARKWLVDQDYALEVGRCANKDDGFYCEVILPDYVTTLSTHGITMEEAEANCYVACVKAMREVGK